MTKVLTQAEAVQLLDYNPETGEFFWKRRPLKFFPNERACKIWNTRYAGAPAFSSIHNNGYRAGVVLYGKYLAHRIAWLIQTGDWPEQQIDHVNGDKADNRFSNLRAVSPLENSRNLRRQDRNKSGVTGVAWCSRAQKWRSHITVNGHMKSLGYTDDFAMAVAKRRLAERELGFHPNHGRSA